MLEVQALEVPALAPHPPHERALPSAQSVTALQVSMLLELCTQKTQFSFTYVCCQIICYDLKDFRSFDMWHPLLLPNIWSLERENEGCVTTVVSELLSPDSWLTCLLSHCLCQLRTSLQSPLMWNIERIFIIFFLLS